MVAENLESNKFYDAFGAFDPNADLVVAERYGRNKLYDTFDWNAH